MTPGAANQEASLHGSHTMTTRPFPFTADPGTPRALDALAEPNRRAPVGRRLVQTVLGATLLPVRWCLLLGRTVLRRPGPSLAAGGLIALIGLGITIAC